MATITLQTSMSGPTEGGSCRVLYQVTNADGLAPEIFVIRQHAPAYKGADPQLTWEHVAYADEMSNLPVSAPDDKRSYLIRKAIVTVEYTALDKAQEAIESIRGQVQRLVNEINTLDTYSETNTWIISSTN